MFEAPKQLIRSLSATVDGSAVVEVYKDDAGNIQRSQSYTKAQLTDMIANADARLADTKAKVLAQLDAQNVANKARLSEMLALLK